jgi:hypothetical protein
MFTNKCFGCNGKELNELNKNHDFCKLINSEKDDGFRFNGLEYKYKLGENVCSVQFMYNEYQGGGYYFTTKEHIFIHGTIEPNENYCKITIPDDAKCYVMKKNIKSNKIIIHNFIPLSDLDWNNTQFCMEAIKQNGYTIEFVKNKTNDMYIAAVQQNEHVLCYIIEQTEEICLEAVKETGEALEHVKNKTYKICMAAIKQSADSLKHVKNRTDSQNQITELCYRELCMEAVKQKGMTLQYVDEHDQTNEICMEAIKQNWRAIYFVVEQTKEMCIKVVRQDWRAIDIDYVMVQTHQLCMEAVKCDWRALFYVEEKVSYRKICKEAMKQNINALEDIKTDEFTFLFKYSDECID